MEVRYRKLTVRLLDKHYEALRRYAVDKGYGTVSAAVRVIIVNTLRKEGYLDGNA